MAANDKADLMAALIIEILNSFFALRQAGQELDMVSESGGGLWGLMRILHDEGPQRLSDVARRRSVSRQYIQKIANQLADGGLVRMKIDPSDRRAKRMVLTAKGRARYDELNQRFLRVVAALAPDFTAAELKTAVKTVASVRAGLLSLTPEA